MGDRRENLDKRNTKKLRIGNRECSVNLTIAANALSIKIIPVNVVRLFLKNASRFCKQLFRHHAPLATKQCWGSNNIHCIGSGS